MLESQQIQEHFRKEIEEVMNRLYSISHLAFQLEGRIPSQTRTTIGSVAMAAHTLLEGLCEEPLTANDLHTLMEGTINMLRQRREAGYLAESTYREFFLRMTTWGVTDVHPIRQGEFSEPSLRERVKATANSRKHGIGPTPLDGSPAADHFHERKEAAGRAGELGIPAALEPLLRTVMDNFLRDRQRRKAAEHVFNYGMDPQTWKSLYENSFVSDDERKRQVNFGLSSLGEYLRNRPNKMKPGAVFSLDDIERNHYRQVPDGPSQNIPIYGRGIAGELNQVPEGYYREAEERAEHELREIEPLSDEDFQARVDELDQEERSTRACSTEEEGED